MKNRRIAIFLIVLFGVLSLAGCGIEEPEEDEVYIEYAGFPEITIYENGYLKEEASHNHGRSNLDDFWPYYLYQYNEETDIYERTACMDAWEQRVEDAEYEKWCENYNTAKKIEILWYPIISEEKYNEMHSDTAAG